jgi:hypothetical protein
MTFHRPVTLATGTYPVGSHVIATTLGNDGPVRVYTGVVVSNENVDWLGPNTGHYNIDCHNGEQIVASTRIVTCDHHYDNLHCVGCGRLQGQEAAEL